MKPNKLNLAVFFTLLLIIDQVSKFIIKLNMTIGEAISVFGDWFYILFVENPGAAFGMSFGGVAGKIFLTLFRIVAIGLLTYYILKLLKRLRSDRRSVPTGVMIGLVLIVAGAAGNLVDSLFYGMIFSESTPYEVATLFPEGGGYAPFLQGKVVDMLYFPIIKSTYPAWFPGVGGEEFIFFSPIFNLADTYITCGFIYLLLFQHKFFMHKA